MRRLRYPLTWRQCLHATYGTRAQVFLHCISTFHSTKMHHPHSPTHCFPWLSFTMHRMGSFDSIHGRRARKREITRKLLQVEAVIGQRMTATRANKTKVLRFWLDCRWGGRMVSNWRREFGGDVFRRLIKRLIAGADRRITTTPDPAQLEIRVHVS